MVAAREPGGRNQTSDRVPTGLGVVSMYSLISYVARPRGGRERRDDLPTTKACSSSVHERARTIYG